MDDHEASLEQGQRLDEDRDIVRITRGGLLTLMVALPFYVWVDHATAQPYVWRLHAVKAVLFACGLIVLLALRDPRRLVYAREIAFAFLVALALGSAVSAMYSNGAAAHTAFAVGIALVGGAAMPWGAAWQSAAVIVLVATSMLASIRLDEPPVGVDGYGTLVAVFAWSASILLARIGSLRRRELAAMAVQSSRLFAELEHANEIKSDFLATMSHELRTPLNVIIGYQELLLDGTFGEISDEQRDPLRRADRNARELLALINTTLELSRLDASASSVTTVPIDLRAIFDDLGRGQLLPAAKSHLRVEWDVAPGTPVIDSDTTKIRMILNNLLHNAVKFTEHGAIRVSARPCEHGVEIAVEDTGIGIPVNVRSVVFEAFRQGDAEINRRYGGAGLGLHIVARLVEILGGSIELSSDVGRGTRVVVTLPLHSSMPTELDTSRK